jgi:two-component system cell cycle sensor histidine kinase/response regulator CckA
MTDRSDKELPLAPRRPTLTARFQRFTNLVSAKPSSAAILPELDRLQSIFERAGVGMVMLDPKGNIISANPAIESMLGYERRAMCGKPLNTMIHPDDAAESLTLFHEVAAGERENYHTESRFCHRDGSHIWGNMTVSRVPGNDASPDAVMGIVLNISAHAKAEAELQSATRALRTLSECNQALLRVPQERQLLDSVCRIIVEVGGYRMAWVGFAEDDQEKTVTPVAAAGDAKDFLADLKLSWAPGRKNRGITVTAIQTAQTGIVKDIEADRDCGPWRSTAIARGFVSAIALPLTADNKTLGALTIFADKPDAFDPEEVSLLSKLADNLSFGISTLRVRRERERAEREKENIQSQLFQSQKMEALGRLAGGIAHDFNNLLTEIIGYSELLLTSVSKDDPRRTDIDTIKAAGERASILTHQLLAFSRNQVIQPKLLCINEVVSSMQHMLRRMIGEDIETVTYLDPGAECIKADRGQIEQLILNLVVNARHAMPRGGKLVLGTEYVTLTGYDCKLMPEARAGEFVCITVSDSGIGMDDSTMQHIFNPFFSTKGPAKGSGLGLSVVYGIIKQHAGWISVSSRIGEGTTFKVYLPAHSKNESEEGLNNAVPLQKLQGNGERILLVEDEEGIRRFACDTLQRHGYDVFTAANAKEALDTFHREHGQINLVFSDAVLPDLGGPELTEQFRSENPNLKILITSGHTFDKLQLEESVDKQVPFLQKPYNVPVLLQAVKQALASARS